ncbi:MAG TPA: ABC transporter substrate-binding protein [Usitatibacter sp.]|jgi:peptide/nickel transport system substrate-binding protein|nr:ABC transporter substrate-binding protein [Usitatibacter sp.]
MTLPRIARAAAAAALALAAALACPVPAFAAKSDDTLVVALQRGITSVDYLYTTKREYIILSLLTDDGLTEVDPETLEVRPLAARSWKAVDDKTIDVTIRDDVKFHDGSPLTADDVVYTYEWVLNPKSRANRSRQFGEWLASVQKTGPSTVRFHMKYPFPLALHSMGMSMPLRKKGTYDDIAKTGALPLGQSLNGIGPYRVVSVEPGRKTVIERFDGYYKDSPKGRPAIKRIVFREIPDWGTQQAELMSGGVQWAYDVPYDIASALGGAGPVEFVNGPSLRVGFIVLDAAGVSGKDNPLTKLAVRRALNHAIDREAIVKNIVKGDARVIDSACHPAQFGCAQDVMKYPYDPARARALLKEAGYPDGFSFDLWAYREKDSAEAIAADLAKVGVKANLRYVPLATLDQARKKHQIQSYFGSWESGSVPDTAAIADVHWSATTDRNMSGDPEVTADMIGAQRIADPAKRKALYEKGLKRIAEQAYWVPLYTFSLNYLVAGDLAFNPPKDGLPRLYLTRWK